LALAIIDNLKHDHEFVIRHCVHVLTQLRVKNLQLRLWVGQGYPRRMVLGHRELADKVSVSVS